MSDVAASIFDAQRRIEYGTLNHHDGSVTCLEFFQSTHLLSGSVDKSIALWRCKDWEPACILQGHTCAHTAQ